MLLTPEDVNRIALLARLDLSDAERAAMLGQLNDYLDGDLAAELCQALETHMAGCHDCQIVFDTLGQTIPLIPISSTLRVCPLLLSELTAKT